MLMASGDVGLGVGLIGIAVLSGFYSLGPLGRTPQAGLFIPGPFWFRRIVVGITGTFALVAGIAMLAMK
jgi:hypothetical protein